MRLLVLGTARADASSWRAARRACAARRVRAHRRSTGLDRRGDARADRPRRRHARSSCSGCTEETEGNPFFIEETLRSLPELEERALSRIAVPEGVKELIGRRLAAALRDDQPGAQRRARGRPRVPPRRCSRRCSTTTTRSTRSRRRRAGGLVREADELDRFAFAHALVRETLYEGQSTSRRVRLHRRIGEALRGAAGDANPAELAYHFHEGRAPRGRRLRARRRRAGDRRARLRGGGRALPAAPGDDLATPPRARRRRAARRRPRRRARRSPRAAELAREQGDRDALAEAALGLLRPPRRGGRDRRARRIALLEEALDALARRPPARRAAAGAARRRACSSRARQTRRERAQRRGAGDGAPARRPARAARRARGPPRRAAARRPPRRAAARSSEELLELATRIEERELEALGHHWRIYDLLEAGRIEDARTAHRELEHARRRAAPAALPPLRASAGRSCGRRWRAASSDAERLAREAFEYGVRAQARDAETIFTAQNLILRRREEGLSDHVATIAGLRRAQPGARARGAAILPMAHLMAGDTPAGVAQFRALAQRRVRRDPARHVLVHGDRAARRDVRAAARRRAGARSSIACSSRTRTSSCRSARPRASGPTHRFLALLAAATGDLDRARAPLRRRAGAQRGVRAAAGGGADAARVRRAAARARRDASGRRALLEETLREAEAGGMSQLITRVQTRLAELQTSA